MLVRETEPASLRSEAMPLQWTATQALKPQRGLGHIKKQK